MFNSLIIIIKRYYACPLEDLNEPTSKVEVFQKSWRSSVKMSFLTPSKTDNDLSKKDT